MFLAKIGKYKPCGLFTTGHYVILCITVLIIALALFLTKNKKKPQIKRIIQIIVSVLWVLEIFRIGYKLWCGDRYFYESYLPLYFCSIFLYSGVLSAFGTGKVQRAGDVVLATGALIGGWVFLVYPATSLPDYPAWHFVSVHSFLYHGCMVYVGILMLITRYIELQNRDVFLYALSVLAISAAAYLVNAKYGCNLMFLSKAFPGSFGAWFYKVCGSFYAPVLVLVHIAGPFYLVYGIYKLCNKCRR